MADLTRRLNYTGRVRLADDLNHLVRWLQTNGEGRTQCWKMIAADISILTEAAPTCLECLASGS